MPRHTAPERAASQRDGAEALESTPYYGDPVVHRALAWFASFDELDSVMRRLVAREQRVTKKEAGTTLVERGSLEKAHESHLGIEVWEEEQPPAELSGD